ncbi:MAG: hypothetical protein KGL39_20380 [Patescibacteria group bacterium]|nr:hypothetical protein [Patescibacteria group bacterium]
MPSLAELGQKVKAKYPGTYDHLNDTELGQRVTEKYPEYAQQFSDVPKPALPGALAPDKPESTLKSIAMVPVRGGQQFAHGVEAVANKRYVPGAADIFEGGGKVLSPLLIPAAVANPIGTAAALGGGYLASKGGEAAAQHFGASPDTARLVGDVAGLAGGALLAKGTTAIAQRVAPSLAETAIGVRARERQFGSQPGLAVLKETRGFSPESVSRSAGQRIQALMPVMERTVELGSPVDRSGALGVVRNARALATRQGDLSSFNDLGSMEDALTRNRVTGEEYPPLMPARSALELKRGFGREQGDFIRLPGRTSLATQTARSAYSSMADAIHQAAPGSTGLDDRIQSLIPVRDRASVKGLSADGIERAVDRATRPTGGFLPTIFGFTRGGLAGAAEALGAQEMPRGGLAGAAEALGAQEMLASPSVKMALARGLWRGAGGERLGVPSMPEAPAFQPRGLLSAPNPENRAADIFNDVLNRARYGETPNMGGRTGPRLLPAPEPGQPPVNILPAGPGGSPRPLPAAGSGNQGLVNLEAPQSGLHVREGALYTKDANGNPVRLGQWEGSNRRPDIDFEGFVH